MLANKEVKALITAMGAGIGEEDTDLDKLREKLMKIGDSVVIAHDGDFIKVQYTQIALAR